MSLLRKDDRYTTQAQPVDNRKTATASLAAPGSYNPATATSSNYQPANAVASTMNAAKSTAANYKPSLSGSANYEADKSKTSSYDATKYSADERNVGHNSTVAGQLTGLLNKDNPYMKRAETAGLQYANKRGLLNSTFGVNAAHGAAIDRALPIAQADAATYNNQSLTNQGYSNDARKTNAAEANEASRFNAANQQQVNLANQNAENEASRFNAANQQQTELANQEALNRAGEYNASNAQQTNLANQASENDTNRFNATQNTNVSLANQAAQNEAGRFNTTQDTNVSLANQDAQNQANQFNATQQTNVGLANQDALNRTSQFNATTAFNEWSQQSQQNHALVMENLSTENKDRLIQIEMAYKSQMANEKSASEAYRQALDAMGAALGNSKLSAAQQQRAVDEITQQLEAHLDFSSILLGSSAPAPNITQQSVDYNAGRVEVTQGQQSKINDMQRALGYPETPPQDIPDDPQAREQMYLQQRALLKDLSNELAAIKIREMMN